MNWVLYGSLVALLCLLALSAYIDRIYFEMGKFLSREYEENVDAWERWVEPKLRLGSESAAMSASVLRQIVLGALVFLLAFHLHGALGRSPWHVARAVFELFLVLLIFDRLIPELIFTRTRGAWVKHTAGVIRLMFYLVLPVTLAIGLLLSIAGLAAPEAQEPEHPGEAMDALLEAGEEEGILEESDRELVRNVVEFGDKVVREVMTPRPEMFAVPGTMSLEEFTAQVNEHGFSRVPVYAASLDEVTGIVFARDMLGVPDAEAARRKVAQLQRPVMFIPESKKVNELLREMQRQKQHMSVVIDEYGGVAGLVTIEDLLEAIVGNIEDEHDEHTSEEAPVAEGDGAFVVPGSFDVSSLRELFEAEASECLEASPEEEEAAEQTADEAGQVLSKLLAKYEATTIGGLVSEIAGHIPLPGEVVEDGPLRLEVVASSDRRVERVRVALLRESRPAEASEPE
jgi:CBS domain containing-hemolysin-like protein